MTAAVYGFAALTAMTILVAGLIYRWLWIRFRSQEIVPTGFGAILSFALLAAALALGMPGDVTLAYGVIAAASAIYWFDDAIELSPKSRILISFVTGVAVAWLLLAGFFQTAPLLIGLCLAAGVINVGLTNVVNFYDGNDLNIATLIGLLAVTTLVFSIPGSFMQVTALVTLAVVIPFAILNSRPRTIYFGDAGCFAVASLLTAMVAIYVRGANDFSPAAVIPMALPTLDVFFVLGIRIVEKHDLLTRNYLHLYQKLNQRYRGFGYLAPQPLNVALVLGLYLAMRAMGGGAFVSTLLAAAVVTPIVYFGARRLFLR